MLNPFTNIARFIGSRKGAAVVLAGWLLIIGILSGLAPGAKEFAINSGDGSIHEDMPSAAAEELLNEHFPTKDGLSALLVFHSQQEITEDERAEIARVSAWLASSERPKQVVSAVPFHQLPKAAQDNLFSEDNSTLLLNVSLAKELSTEQMFDALDQIRTFVEQVQIDNMQFEITGPAGISSDTLSLFKNADFVLMLATIVLILLILLVIYRSPLLAVIPLIIAGMVYMVVDRVLGLGAQNGWFIVDKQALSIMMILLFAVLTDYCLFVFSRYKEELKVINSKYDAMRATMSQLAEPIVFSGGTILIAMLTLFAAVFKPYHSFAPVFSIAVIVILLGGLTLIPAVFALVGRKAFWPFVPKLELKIEQPSGFWSKMGTFVTKKPAITAASLLSILILASANTAGIQYSFNLMKSFPEDISSRKGFEILQEQFPQGQLAPVSIILQSDKEIVLDAAFSEKLVKLESALKNEKISLLIPKLLPVSANNEMPITDNSLSDEKHFLKLQAILDDHPYEQSALNVIEALRKDSGNLLLQSDFDPLQYSLHYGGQTAEQLDVQSMNERDTVLIFLLIAVFITVMLAAQSRSLRMAVIMVATILLSYTATLGLGWIVFHNLLGYEAVSYRLPLYTFVFLVALGIDYNIMLVSRIKEEARNRDWKEAIRRGVALTGGVISSAGIILAATFGVLISQPLQELFLFGMLMTMGILIDTFLVRGMLLPAIMTLLGPRGSHKKNKKGV